MDDILQDTEVTSNDKYCLQNTIDDDFTLEEKNKDVVVPENIGLILNSFKNIIDPNTRKSMDKNGKNTEKIREEKKVKSRAEKYYPEKSSENANSNAFHEVDSARTIKDIC